MNVYEGGYGKCRAYVVAKDEADAAKELAKRGELKGLPVEAKEIIVEGYTITATAKKASK